MNAELWLLITGLVLYLIPFSYLERLARQINSSIKKSNNLSPSYKVLDTVFVIVWIGTLIIQVEYKLFSSVITVFAVFIALDLLKMGLYASVTGKFPYRTRGGFEYFYTNYSEIFMRQKLITYHRNFTTRFIGGLTILVSLLYIVVLFILHR